MTTPIHLLSFAAALMLSNITILSAQNLVLNSGFESGKEDWNLFIPPESKGFNSTWTIESAEPHSGASVAVMKTDEPIRWSIANRRPFSVNPGEKYRVTAWVKFGKDAKMDNLDGFPHVRLTLFDDVAKLSISDPQGHIYIGLSGDVARNQSVRKLAVPKLPVGWQKINGVV